MRRWSGSTDRTGGIMLGKDRQTAGDGDPDLIGVIIVTFLLTRVLPGDPAVYFAGPAATPQSIAEIRKSLGLDRPLPEQFVRYVDDLAHGDLGNSLSTGQPVVTEIAAACRPPPSSRSPG